MTVFAGLHGMFLTEQDAAAAVQQLAWAAHRMVPTAAGAGISLMDDDGTRVSAAATDDLVEVAEVLDGEGGQTMSGQMPGGSSAMRLHELLLESDDISGFLGELAVTAAQALSMDGVDRQCAVVLLRPKQAATVASSCPEVERLDVVQAELGDGPCLMAAREGREVYLADVRTDPRWPQYAASAIEAGIFSVYGLPLDLGGEAFAALDVYADRPDAFDDGIVEAIRHHAMPLSTTLRLGVRLAGHRDAEAHLKAALASRRDIDLAVGITMGQKQCTQDEAITILRSASNRYNVKLRDLAAELVHRVGGGPAATHFEN